MGVLTDFVVVDSADGQRVCDSACPSQDFAGLDAKGIDTVKLGTLNAILNNTEFDPSFMSDSLLCSGSDEGPWVFRIPVELVEQLARLSGKPLRSVGARWAATEEFSPQYDNWPAEAVQQVLKELASLCQRAVSEGKVVLMWMCL